jgi:hypothetical protein
MPGHLVLGLVLLAAAASTPARAEAPPWPDATGAGALPAVRAAAAGEATPALPEGAVPLIAAGPQSGPAIRLGGFGFPVAQPAPVPTEPGRQWTITPSLGVQLLGTDNLFQTPHGHRADMITTITPGLLLGADTAWLRGVLNYAPSALVYAVNPGQDRVDHRLNGQALATLVPDLLFLDLRGASAVQTLTGGLAPESGLVTDRRNQVQTTSLQLSPYFLHRFGTAASLQLGYGLQYVNQSGASGAGQTGLTAAGLPLFARQSFVAHEGYAVLRSGPDLGRLGYEARLGAIAYNGTGVLDGAFRRNATLEARYAILRGVAVLLEGGYERQHFAGTPGINIDGPTYSVGTRLDFADESWVIAKFGRHDGFDSAFLNASVALGGRTRFAASYGEQLTASTRRAADLLSSSTLDAQGYPVDPGTGLPAVQPFANSFLALQSSLLRVRAATAAIVQRWPHDTIAVAFQHEERVPVSTAPGTIAAAQRGISGSLTWAHALTERTTAVGYVQYGRFNNALLGKGDLASGSLTLTHQLQPQLLATLQLGVTARGNSQPPGGTALQNIILIGMRQVF